MSSDHDFRLIELKLRASTTPVLESV